jgi:hypothetical protein
VVAATRPRPRCEARVPGSRASTRTPARPRPMPTRTRDRTGPAQARGSGAGVAPVRRQAAVVREDGTVRSRQRAGRRPRADQFDQRGQDRRVDATAEQQKRRGRARPVHRRLPRRLDGVPRRPRLSRPALRAADRRGTRRRARLGARRAAKRLLDPSEGLNQQTRAAPPRQCGLRA